MLENKPKGRKYVKYVCPSLHCTAYDEQCNTVRFESVVFPSNHGAQRSSQRHARGGGQPRYYSLQTHALLACPGSLACQCQCTGVDQQYVPRYFDEIFVNFTVFHVFKLACLLASSLYHFLLRAACSAHSLLFSLETQLELREGASSL